MGVLYPRTLTSPRVTNVLSSSASVDIQLSPHALGDNGKKSDADSENPASSLTLVLVKRGDGDKGRTRPCTNVKRKTAPSIHHDPADVRLQMHNYTTIPRDCTLEALDVRDEDNLGAQVS